MRYFLAAAFLVAILLSDGQSSTAQDVPTPTPTTTDYEAPPSRLRTKYVWAPMIYNGELRP